MHKSAYEDAKVFCQRYVNPPCRVLDVGGLNINGCLRPLFAGCDYLGADLSKGRNVDLVLSKPYHWPELEKESFDVLVSTQVLEHVPKPWLWIKEAVKVLKPGGIIYLCSPNTMPYHEYPVDAWRIWPEGMKALLEEGGFEVLESYAVGRDTTGIGRKPCSPILENEPEH